MSKPHQNMKSTPHKTKNQVKIAKPTKITNNSTNTYALTNKSKSNFKQLLSSSHFSQFQKPNNINYSMYQQPNKPKQNHKSEQKVVSAQNSRSKEAKKYINTNEKKASLPKNQQKNKKQAYETLKFNEMTARKKVNPESFEHTQENNKLSILNTPKPEKIFKEMQSKAYSSIQKVQSARMENLKRYLHEDTEKLTKIKKNSDAHIIQQLSLSQHNFQKSLQETLAQTRTLQIQHYKQIEQVREKYETMIEQSRKQIDSLVFQLREQRTSRVKSDVLLKQNEVKMRCIKEKLEEKQALCKKLTQALENQKRLKQTIQTQLETSIQERKNIKKQVQAVLYVVREQIKQKAAETNKAAYQ